MRVSTWLSDEGVSDLERCSHRAFRIILVRDRGSEHRHDGVADELLDRAAVALQLGAHSGVVAVEGCPDVLRIHALRASRRPDQVDEQDRHDLAFLAHGRDVQTQLRNPHRTARQTRSHGYRTGTARPESRASAPVISGGGGRLPCLPAPLRTWLPDDLRERANLAKHRGRRRADLNRCTRLCRPLPNPSATSPRPASLKARARQGGRQRPPRRAGAPARSWSTRRR